MNGSVSLINGHMEDSNLRRKLKLAIKNIDYSPVPGALKVNLYNQFSESALEEIIDQLIMLGVTFKEHE